MLPWKLSNSEAWVAGRSLITDQARLTHGPLGVLVTTTHAATRWNVSIEGKPFACNPEAIPGEMAMALPTVEAQIRRLVGALTCLGFGVPSEATLFNKALDGALIAAGVPEGLGLIEGVQWLAADRASIRASILGCGVQEAAIVDSLTDGIRLLGEWVDTTEKERKEAETSNEEACYLLSLAQTNVDRLQAKVVALQAEVGNWRRQFDAARDALDGKAAEIATLRAASQDGCWLHGSQPDVEALQTEIDNLRELAVLDAATIAKLEGEAATARSLRAAEVERLRPEEGWLLAPYLKGAGEESGQ